MQNAINEQEDVSDILLTALKWTNFCETYFRNPDDTDKPLKLEVGQRKAINALQFGYDIEYVPNGYVVENPPKIIVMIWGRQLGKTVGVALTGATLLCLQPGVKIGVMAQSEKIAKEFITRTKNIIFNSPFKKHLQKSLKLELVMDHGGYMEAHATSESIRGLSYHYLILDEASRIADEIIEVAAMHTTRKIGKRIIMLSTPKGYGGALIKYYQQGLKTRSVVCKKCFTEFTQAHFKVAQWDAMYMAKGLPACPECGFYLEDKPNEYDEDVIEGQTYFYGVGDYTVISVNPFSSSFYTKEEILAELYRRGNTPKARQELLGEIIAEGMGVFRKEWVDACIDTALENVMRKKQDTNYILGIDFGKVHDNSVMCVTHEDFRAKQIILDYLKVIQSDEIEYEDIKNQVIEVVMYFEPIWIVADATGMGEPIIEQMEKDLRNLGWSGRIYCNKNNRLGFIFDVKSKPDLIENLVELFARKKIKIPPQYEENVDILYRELLNFNYEMTKANYIKFGVQSDHDDSVIALALSSWAHKVKPWIPLAAVFAAPRGGLL